MVSWTGVRAYSKFSGTGRSVCVIVLVSRPVRRVRSVSKRLTSPSVAAQRAELQLRMQDALNSMDSIDREVLTLRHFEQLSNSEAAQVLGLKPSAAANRYVRALERLRDILGEMPGGLDGL